VYRHVLVTGGAGFIGSAFCIALRTAFGGNRITAFDNLHRRGAELNLPRLSAFDIRFVHGDIRASEDLAMIHPAPDLIIECSAEPSAQAGYQGCPEYLINTNLFGFYRCLELARQARADFIFPSTSRVYPFVLLNQLRYEETESRFALLPAQELTGASEAGISEDFPLDGPRSLYGMTKLAAELMLAEYADAYGLRYIINRCGLITGPGQFARSDQGVFAMWLAAHYFGRPLRYIGFGGAGKQVRDFLHIDDLCDLILDQIRNFSLYTGRSFNVGGGAGNSLSLREATELCRQVTGKIVPVAVSSENRSADVRIYVTDHRRVTAIAGWRPHRNAFATLADIAEWITAQESALRPVLFG